MLYTKLWAKTEPFHLLWHHLLDVAAVCQALLPRFGSIEGLPAEWVCYLVGLHDIGKGDAHFQMKAPEFVGPLEEAGLELCLPEDTIGFRHEARSADWIKKYLQDRHGWNSRVTEVVSRALRGHHGDFRAGNKPGACYEEVDYPRRTLQWTPLREDLANLLRDMLHVQDFALQEWEDASAAGMKLSGLVVLSDWIASNASLYLYEQLPKSASPEEYFKAAQHEAERVVHNLDLDTRASADTTVTPLFKDVWPQAEFGEMRPSQRALEAECVKGVPLGLVIIEAPMGEGKTEGAVYLKQYWSRCFGRSGAYIGLPTQATSNQMHGRYARFLATDPNTTSAPRLIHGMAWLLDDKTPDAEAQTFGSDTGDEDKTSQSLEWFQNAKRALIAPEGVGTIDQVLMAALNVRHGFLRYLGLYPKVLIIDEVHAYDEFMTTLMAQLLRWLHTLNIPVILLSATLSYRQKRALVKAYRGEDILPAPPEKGEAYPLLTFVPHIGAPRVVPVERDPARDRTIQVCSKPGLLHDHNGTAQLAIDTTQNGGCACILANTVKAAQRIYRALIDKKKAKKIPEDTEIILFHARFRAKRRQEIENRVTSLFGKDAGKEGNPERPKRAILVATQVVEQSLDVDFDVMISQLAPIDLLLQRCGRMWRHERGDRPTGPESILYVLLPDENSFDFKTTGKVYLHEPLLRTLALLKKHKVINLPDDFRPLIEGCYGDSALPDGIDTILMQKAITDRIAEEKKAQKEARTHLIPEPRLRSFPLGDPANKGAVEEGEEGEAASYFRARTRRGDETIAAIVLHEADLIQAVRNGIEADRTKTKYYPGKPILKRLFLQKVNLPFYWFSKAVPAEGFELIREGPKWLRHHVVIPMRDGRWQGYWQTEKGDKAFTILDSREEGLLIEELDSNEAPNGEYDDDI